MELTGAKIIMECLLEQGVDTIFGYPGGTIINVYDALYDYQEKIHHILTSHEQGASHAADGYYRATGKTGVCFATSGPGATNLTTGIATAYYDSSAVVFLSCNVNANVLGKDAFQEVDLTGIAMPITKACYLVDDVTTVSYTHLDVYKRQVLTRERSYIKKEEKALELAALRYRRYPAFAAALRGRTRAYNENRAALFELEREGRAFLIAPQSTAGWHRTESDPVHLKQMYQQGYGETMAQMQALRAYLAE